MPGDNDLITSKCITFHATTSALAVDIRVVVVVAIAVVFAIVAVAIVGIVASAASVVTLL